MSKADMMKKLGITEEDFKPKKDDNKERIEILEQAFIEFVNEVLADD